MTEIEGAVLGRVPISVTKKVLMFDKTEREFITVLE